MNAIPATKVKQLDFSDLYLGHPSVQDRFSDVPGANANPLPAGPELRSDLDQLLALCRNEIQAASTGSEFKVCHDNITYRVTVVQALGGTVFVLRKMANVIQSLAELGIPQVYVRHLMSKQLSGLLLVSGTGKSGKTMTASAIVKERLAAYGGIAVTGEDPIELPLEGAHGDGVCFQTVTPRDRREFSERFRGLTRLGARMILVDEIRDQETAAEVLQASVNGSLIISTVMADNTIQAITKLHMLANPRMAAGSAQALLADGLAGVLHQQIVRGPRPKLEAELFTLKDAPVARTILRNGKYDMLASEIKQQIASMISEGGVVQRIKGQ
ncbi:ATPase, T2SS/T4P/T4SS family [Herbaspirillum sp. GCM10030257]|uniref:ATPase, T2SS/T4P/T4SS family n=1 Tax=Herbaspirillum sp. GCM10030257 TaxID=3273393 RepID=UPI00360CBBCF